MADPSTSPYRIVHVDPRIVVVDKRSGSLVQRTPTSKEPALIDVLGAELGFVHPVHRLDRHVSGLVVYGRDADAATHMRQQFAERRADRRYLAGITGIPEAAAGVLRSRLWMNPSNYAMRSSRRADAALAVTHWWLVEAMPAGDAALVEVALETGVKNQIRVQFAEAGHPLLGEQKYLPEGVQGARTTQRRRLFLHAAHLTIRHPDDDREVEFSAPLPGDLTRWKGRLRQGDRRSEGEARPRRRDGGRSRGPTAQASRRAKKRR